MAPVPDLDFDGVDDVVIAGVTDDIRDTGIAGGAVYCYSGATGTLLYSVASPNPVHLGYFGASVVGVGDVDGDGAGDFAVGTLFEEAVYVFSGGKGRLLRVLTSPVDPCRFGASLSTVPDVDDDGIDDLGVGAQCDLGFGRVHIYSGASGVYLRSLASPGESDGTRYFGTILSGIGDVDGDGAGDVVVGDPYRFRMGNADQFGGAAYVFSGATGKILHEVLTPTPYPSRFFGDTVAGLHDLNGDGADDFAVGASQYTGLFNSSGRVYVYNGANGSLMYELASPYEQGAGRFGWGLKGVPDIDGDGAGDLFIGAWGETPPNFPPRSGSAYLISGASGQPLRRFVSPSPNRRNANFGTYLGVLADRGRRGGISFASASGDCAAVCDPDPLGRTYIFRFCSADWDYNGVTDSRDFFQFLAAFFEKRADFNRDGATDSRDFFEFLADFLGGCDD